MVQRVRENSEFLGLELFSIGMLPATGEVSEQLAVLRSRLLGRSRDDTAAIEARLEHQVEPLRYVLDNPLISTMDGSLHVFDRVLVTTIFRRQSMALSNCLTKPCLGVVMIDRSDAEILLEHQVERGHVGGGYYDPPDEFSGNGPALLGSRSSNGFLKGLKSNSPGRCLLTPIAQLFPGTDVSDSPGRVAVCGLR